MTRITLAKHHGLGNDFLVAFDVNGVDAAALARRVCDRRRGIGADGLLLAAEADGFDARMTLYNADGSPAEMSGNGIRCFAQALATRRGGDLAPQRILTAVGPRLVDLAATSEPDTVMASVDMGPVEKIDEPAGWARLACHPDRPVAHVSLGNPHSVVAVDDVHVVDLAKLGGLVPHVNLEIVQPGERPHDVRMRVHERGAGITEACGSGACAAAHAAVRWGFVTPRHGKVVVHMDGGSATVELDRPAAGRVTLTGPATYVGRIEIELT